MILKTRGGNKLRLKVVLSFRGIIANILYRKRGVETCIIKKRIPSTANTANIVNISLEIWV